MLKQKGKSIVNRFGINQVVVVKHKQEIVWEDGDFIEQGRQNRFDWRWLRGLEYTQHAIANIRRNRLQRSDEIYQKASRVVIPLIQRQPGGWLPASDNPFTH